MLINAQEWCVLFTEVLESALQVEDHVNIALQFQEPC